MNHSGNLSENSFSEDITKLLLEMRNGEKVQLKVQNQQGMFFIYERGIIDGSRTGLSQRRTRCGIESPKSIKIQSTGQLANQAQRLLKSRPFLRARPRPRSIRLLY